MHGNFIFMHEKDISRHENEHFAPGMIFPPHKYSWEIRLFAISSTEFSSMKTFGGKSFIFIHVHLIFMHENVIHEIMAAKFSFSCMEI